MCAQWRLRSAWSSARSCAQRVAKYPSFLHADSEDTNQTTGRMPKLIWVFVGRTCHFVGLVMRWLIYSYYSTKTCSSARQKYLVHMFFCLFGFFYCCCFFVFFYLELCNSLIDCVGVYMDMTTLVGHFVSSSREREKRDRRISRWDEREGRGTGRKRNRNESEETEERKISLSTLTCYKDSRPCPTVSQYQLDALVT